MHFNLVAGEKSEATPLTESDRKHREGMNTYVRVINEHAIWKGIFPSCLNCLATNKMEFLTGSSYSGETRNGRYVLCSAMQCVCE